MLASFELVVDPADWASLPASFRETWQRRRPFFVRGLRPHAVREGFVIEWAQTLPGRALKPDDGGLPGQAAQHGITLHVTYEYLLARKPHAV